MNNSHISSEIEYNVLKTKLIDLGLLFIVS